MSAIERDPDESEGWRTVGSRDGSLTADTATRLLERAVAEVDSLRQQLQVAVDAPRETDTTRISGLECELRGLRHHEKRATDELDRAGVEKYDDGDGQGGEWSLWVRIRKLARDRDKFREADAGRLLVERDHWRVRALDAEGKLSTVRRALKDFDRTEGSGRADD